MATSEHRIKTTVIGSCPVPEWLGSAPSEDRIVDATRIIPHTQETAGIDVVCDGEVYRHDLGHPETNGMDPAAVGHLSWRSGQAHARFSASSISSVNTGYR